MIKIFIVLEVENDKGKIGLLKNNLVEKISEFSFIQEDLENIIKKYLLENKIKTKQIILILKEENIYKQFNNFKNINKNEINNLIEKNLDKIISINKNDFIVDYSVLENTKEKTEVMFVSINKKTVDFYLNIFLKLNLQCYLVDFYQNVVSKYFLEIYKEENIFIVHKLENKISFIYIKKGVLKNIRDIFVDEKTDLKMEINKSFEFYNLEFYKISKGIFLDDIPLVENFFKSENIIVENNIEIDKNKLSFYNLNKSIKRVGNFKESFSILKNTIRRVYEKN